MGDNIRNDGANMGGDLDSEFHSLTEYLMTTLKDQECGPAPVPIIATALQPVLRRRGARAAATHAMCSRAKKPTARAAAYVLRPHAIDA
jgi:hypothetical protein